MASAQNDPPTAANANEDACAEQHSRVAALFAKGFRPFFLLAALHAIVMLPLWLANHAGALEGTEYFRPSSWHAHEMVFGFSVAVIAGFLLTAVSNWTKKPTATSWLLGLLCVVWLLGRVAPFLAPHIPNVVTAALSLAFLPLLVVVLAKPIFEAGSRRNYGIVLALAALSAAQVVTHVGAIQGNYVWEMAGSKAGVYLVIVLILVVGGRVVPLFTRNATKDEGIRSIRALDLLSIASAVAVAVMDMAQVHHRWVGVAAAIAAVFSLGRAVHWGFRASLRVPLLWVLHLGYLFVPVGFGLRALSELVPLIGTSTALHALTAGAIGTLTLGMMVRVSIGHTGRPMVCPRVLTVAFVFMIAAACLRVIAPLVGGAGLSHMLYTSGVLWSLAFLIYLVRIGPILTKPRPDGRPG